MAVAAAWIVFAAVLVCVFLFSLVVVKYYSDPHEAHGLCTTVTVGSLATVLLCVAAIPVDVYLVSSTVDVATGVRIADSSIQDRVNQMQTVYYILYVCVMVFNFLLIPFSYFFYEEDDEDATTKSKVLGALKYTIGFVIIIVVLIVIGLVLRPSKKDNSDAPWQDRLLDADDGGRQAITFTMACIMVAGTIGWVIYGGYGLAAWPVGMARGKKALRAQRESVTSDLAVVREQKRAIEYKYSQLGSGSSISKMGRKERGQLARLRQRERLLQQEDRALDHENKSLLYRISRVLAPFRVMFGILFTLIALFFIVALGMSTVDRLKNSPCSTSCGYVLETPQIPNPVDLALTKAHEVFPIDYIILGFMVVFFFTAIVMGIARIGIRFLWILLYRIKPRGTVPQGLLLMAMIMNFLVLTMSMQFLSLAPQYATFGSQTYLTNGTATAAPSVEPCKIDIDVCTPTRLADLVNRVTVQQPFFGIIFYFENWALMGIFLLALLYSVLRRKPARFEINSDSSDEESA